MIVQEKIAHLIKTYSDKGLKIRQVETGIVYEDAIDIPGKYTYEETDELIEQPEEQPEGETEENNEN